MYNEDFRNRLQRIQDSSQQQPPPLQASARPPTLRARLAGLFLALVGLSIGGAASILFYSATALDLKDRVIRTTANDHYTFFVTFLVVFSIALWMFGRLFTWRFLWRGLIYAVLGALLTTAAFEAFQINVREWPQVLQLAESIFASLLPSTN